MKSVRNLKFSTAMKFKAIPPYDFELTVHKPAGWSLLTPLETFESGVLWTAVRVPQRGLFGLKLKSVGTVEDPEISCQLFSERQLGKGEKARLSETVAFLLNLNENVRQFYALGRRDPLVKVLVEDLYGMRNTKTCDIFSRLILAVTLQMAPITRSDQMMNLLIEEYGETLRFDGREVAYWPSAEKIAKAQVMELKKKCKLGYRAKALRSIAQTVARGFSSLQELEMMSTDDAKARLMELRGIGDYSADIVSPHFGFALDVWSAKIFSMLMFGKKPESPRDMIPKLKKAAEERWGRWRGYVFMYVLHDLENLSRKYNFKLTDV
jgi:3-methyladenine DNA glycosylase/8-oxoguanine DNA glycosylase